MRLTIIMQIVHIPRILRVDIVRIITHHIPNIALDILAARTHPERRTVELLLAQRRRISFEAFLLSLVEEIVIVGRRGDVAAFGLLELDAVALLEGIGDFGGLVLLWLFAERERDQHREEDGRELHFEWIAE